jgi:hypothetical protein
MDSKLIRTRLESELIFLDMDIVLILRNMDNSLNLLEMDCRLILLDMDAVTIFTRNGQQTESSRLGHNNLIFLDMDSGPFTRRGNRLSMI